MPERDRVFAFVQRHRIAEEHGLPAQAHAHPHGQGAVDIRLAGGGHAVVVEQGEHRAYRRAEGGEEIRPAAGGQGADVVLRHVVGVGLQQTGVVQPVLFGGLGFWGLVRPSSSLDAAFPILHFPRRLSFILAHLLILLAKLSLFLIHHSTTLHITGRMALFSSSRLEVQ